MPPSVTLGSALLGAGATVLVGALGFLARRLSRKPRRFSAAPLGPGDPEASIIVVDFPWDFPPTMNLVSASPFVAKLEAWLRFSGLHYEKKRSTAADFSEAPKGKLPIIIHGSNVVPDTHLILKYLARTYGTAVEQVVAPGDAHGRAVATALLALLETHVYYCAVYFKYGMNWAAVAEDFEHIAEEWGVPWGLRGRVARSLQARMVDQSVAQGSGRFTEAELVGLVEESLDALSAVLGHQPFLLGSAPLEADASAFGLLHVLLRHKGAVPQLETLVRRHSNLVEYEQRIYAAYFGEAYKPTIVPGAVTAAQAAAAKKGD